MIFNIALLIGIFKSSYDNVLRWMPQDLIDDKSTLLQVMAWCHQATSHYLNQCWPRFPTPYGVTRPQWAKCAIFIHILVSYLEHFLWNSHQVNVEEPQWWWVNIWQQAIAWTNVYQIPWCHIMTPWANELIHCWKTLFGEPQPANNLVMTRWIEVPQAV